MMFSSNQEFAISGRLSPEYIEKVLKIALDLSGQSVHLSREERERGCMLVYQITPSGSYCIGWGFEHCPAGWSEFQFDFDYEIVARLIKQQLEKCPVDESEDWGDGSYTPGFLAKAIRETFASESGGIKSPSYGIVEFQPFTCFYSK